MSKVNVEQGHLHKLAVENMAKSQRTHCAITPKKCLTKATKNNHRFNSKSLSKRQYFMRKKAAKKVLRVSQKSGKYGDKVCRLSLGELVVVARRHEKIASDIMKSTPCFLPLSSSSSAKGRFRSTFARLFGDFCNQFPRRRRSFLS